MPKEITFVIISFPMSLLFAIRAETKRVLISFRSLHLLDLRIKNFGDLSFIQSMRELVCQIKSGVDMVSHSTLVLFTRREISLFRILINLKLKLPEWNRYLETKIFFKSNLKSIVICTRRCVRFLCANLNFVPITDLGKDLEIAW